jgi:hypothetical protein
MLAFVSFIMLSVLITALIVLENPCKVPNLPQTFELDGQLYVNDNKSLTGVFRYYNSAGFSFEDLKIGFYVTCIHVSLSFQLPSDIH